jgi:hypothetical protein
MARVTITDGLAEELDSQKTAATLDVEVEQRLVETLHAPRSRVVLSLAELEQIAERVGTGLPIRNKADLLRTLDQVARVTLGDVRLVWTPTQLVQIEEKAAKHGMRPAEFVAQVASKLLLDVFNVLPGEQGIFYTPGFDPTDELDGDPEADDGNRTL